MLPLRVLWHRTIIAIFRITRRGGFYINPCHLPATQNCCRRTLFASVVTALLPVGGGVPDARALLLHKQPYIITIYFPIQKRACAPTAHARLLLFKKFYPINPGRTPQTPAKYSGFPPPASGVPGATARPAQNGIPADTRLRSAHPEPPPARAAPVPAP